MSTGGDGDDQHRRHDDCLRDRRRTSAGSRRGWSRRAGGSPRKRPACASWPTPWPRRVSRCWSGTARTPARPTSASPATSESVMQADRLAGLLRALDLAPAVIVGGSGGSRVSLLTAARHPDVASKLAMWWISGGPFGLLTLAMVYCGESIRAAWQDGMEAVVALPEWAEVLERNPGNRQRFLDLDPREFIATLERWMLVYCPDPTGDRSRSARRRVRGTRPADAGVPQRRERSVPHARDVGAGARAHSGRATRRAAVGRPRVDRTQRRGARRHRRPVRTLAAARAPAPRVRGARRRSITGVTESPHRPVCDAGSPRALRR